MLKRQLFAHVLGNCSSCGNHHEWIKIFPIPANSKNTKPGKTHYLWCPVTGKRVDVGLRQ